jgi:uncharacterized protein (DUF1501 family)
MTTFTDLPDSAPDHDQRPAGAHDGCGCGQAPERANPWRRGFTRRRVLQGGTALVAALGVQQVTTRFAFSAPGTAASKEDTLVVVSLRGGMDGLNVFVPAFEPDYYKFRPNIAIPQAALLPLDGRFGMHPALKSLQPFWKSGQLAVVHAVGTPDKTLSHFEAMDTVERGVANGGSDGWLNRVLQARADKGVFSAVQIGSALPTSLTGEAPALAMNGIDSFGLGGLDYIRAQTTTALRKLYANYSHPMAKQADDTLLALDTTTRLQKTQYQAAAQYPDGYFANALREIARLIKANVGLTIATVDVGGWDTHTGEGALQGDLANLLTGLGDGLAAFLTDLGSKIADVTVGIVSEFGRTLHGNANNGTDHGRGQAMIVAGGGVNGGKVYGKWPGLIAQDGYDNSLTGTTDYRSVFGEVLQKRCAVANLPKVFPDHKVVPLGVVKPR